jgi:hypothetical protein
VLRPSAGGALDRRTDLFARCEALLSRYGDRLLQRGIGFVGGKIEQSPCR